MANKKKIVYRLVIVLGFAVCGLLLGMLWAARSGAADDSGLAGGAIVLGYGLVGALGAAIAGLIIGLRLADAALRWSAAACGAIVIVFTVLVTVRVQTARLASLDPPEAYAGIPAFALTLERTERADPVLAKRVTINSAERRWTMRLPDDRSCSSQATALSLRKAATALQEFLEATGGEVACGEDIEAVVSWQTEAGAEPDKGSVRLDATCLASVSEAQLLLFALQQAALTSRSPVKCK